MTSMKVQAMASGSLVPRSVIDACAFHEWPTTNALTPYMPEAWRELILRPSDPSGPAKIKTQPLFVNPRGGKLASAFTAPGLPAASDRDLVTEQLFNDHERGLVVLGYDEGLLGAGNTNYYVARTVATAANDWTAQEWLADEDRFLGMILVASSLPEDAAAEIRRCGQNERFAAVAIGANGMSRPFGHPVYRPIFAACVEMELPVVIQTGSDNMADMTTPPVAGGLPATYGEYRAMSMHSHMSHLASMLVQGVFEEFPRLRVLLVGGGMAWIPSWLWRLDYFYKSSDQDAPWLRQLPSEYFREHVRVSTGGLELPARPEHLKVALRLLPYFDQLLMYASCYPNEDAESPGEIAGRIPEDWKDRVMHDNARDFFRMPSTVVAPTAV